MYSRRMLNKANASLLTSLIFLLSTPPAMALPYEAPIYQIRDYVNETTDCVQRASYGGQTPVLCDIAPALQAAIADCEASVSSWAGDQDVPCRIEGMPGLFYWGSKVTVCHTIDIDLKGAKVMTADAISPIEFRGFGECQVDNRPSAGASRLANAMFRRYSVATPATVIAVEVHAPVKIERVSILGYTQGILVYANAATTQPLISRANANGWRLQDVTVQSSLHAGVWINGPDTNVGLSLRTGATSNCKQGSSLEATLGTCADIFDGSYLGSTWIASATGYAKDTSTNAVFPGLVMGDSANSRSVCVGCYVESGYGGGVVAVHANVVAGIGNWTGDGNVLQGHRISGLEAVGADGLVSVQLGVLTGGGALTLTPIGQSGTYPLRFKYDVGTTNFLLNVGNVNYAHALSIGAKATSNGSLGLGSLVLRPSTVATDVLLNNSSTIVAGQP